MNGFRPKLIVLILLVNGLGAGCAGARANMRVSLDDARYPVSMSKGVPGPGGEILGPDELEVVGSFEAERRGFALLYGGLPLGTINFSEDLNQQISKVGGEAVVRFEVEVVDSNWNFFWPLIWLPIYPGNVQVRVWGDVVRQKKIREKFPPLVK